MSSFDINKIEEEMYDRQRGDIITVVNQGYKSFRRDAENTCLDKQEIEEYCDEFKKKLIARMNYRLKEAHGAWGIQTPFSEITEEELDL